jgi:hypothetical protein
LPGASEVRSLAYAVTDRNYDLVLGLRRHRDWVTIRPRAFEAALDGLHRAYKTVIADISSDVEGERQCGSMDVEERNLMARSTTNAADVVVVIGAAGPRGIHRLVRLIASLLDHGVDSAAILPVVNRAPRSQRNRAEITAALSALALPLAARSPLPTPVFVGERRRFDEVLHAATRLPDGLVAPVTSAARMMLDRIPETRTFEEPAEPALVAVTPGSLGSWHDEP